MYFFLGTLALKVAVFRLDGVVEVWLALKELFLFKLLAVVFVFCVLLAMLFACWLLPLLFVLVKFCVFVLQMSVLLLCEFSSALMAILIESVLSVNCSC